VTLSHRDTPPTEAEKKLALAALEAYRDRENHGSNVDNTAPVDDDLWNGADIALDQRLSASDGKPLSWGALLKRIRDWQKPSGKYALSTRSVVDYLIDWHRQSAPSSSSSRPPVGAKLEINCPNTIFDYRAVIVGQLPQLDARVRLYPAVFVHPKDNTGYFYPQCGPHNPLLMGRAFACLARFGNPNAIWHRRRLPTRFDVRAYALLDRWTESRRLTMTELERLIEPLRDPALAKHKLDFAEKTKDDDVTRNAPGIDCLRIRDARGLVEFGAHQEISCQAPFAIFWSGLGGARLEIRSGEDDSKVWEDAVGSGVTFVLGEQAVPHDGYLGTALDAGLYRVRLYPQKPSFLDPECEWWIRVF
jgi:hypothetical protein